MQTSSTGVGGGFRATVPTGGIKSALCGGNTVRGWIREAEPRADGYRHVDTPAMIEALVAAGVNHYFFCVWDSPTDLEDLREEFAPAAQSRGIQICPYIVPPSETYTWGRASRPHLTDYLAWAREFAQLSLRYPVLTAWAIDDFDCGENPTVFTPEYLAEIRAAQAEINPGLGLLTCAYYGTATSPAFYERYGPYIDAVIYPYLDGPHSNTVVPDRVAADLQEIAEIAGHHDVGVVLLVYAGRFLDGAIAPNEHYVRACLAAGDEAARSGTSLGTVAYGLQLDGSPTISNELRAMDGMGRGALLTSHATIPVHAWAQLATTVEVVSGSPRYELGFWHNRSLQTWRVPRRGDLRLQVLLDGAVVWSIDAYDTNWLNLWIDGVDPQGAFDVTAVVADKATATLAFRLTAMRDLHNVSVDVGIDTISSVGLRIPDPGFEEPAAWTASSSGDAVISLVDVFVPDRPRRIADAATAVFARSGEPAHLPQT